MSWSDPCSNCGQHRADCDCGDWNGYERERWMNKVKKEQNNYPIFKGKKLNDNALFELFKQGKTPMEALNDLGTVV